MDLVATGAFAADWDIMDTTFYVPRPQYSASTYTGSLVEQQPGHKQDSSNKGQLAKHKPASSSEASGSSAAEAATRPDSVASKLAVVQPGKQLPTDRVAGSSARNSAGLSLQPVSSYLRGSVRTTSSAGLWSNTAATTK